MHMGRKALPGALNQQCGREASCILEGAAAPVPCLLLQSILFQPWAPTGLGSLCSRSRPGWTDPRGPPMPAHRPESSGASPVPCQSVSGCVRVYQAGEREKAGSRLVSPGVKTKCPILSWTQGSRGSEVRGRAGRGCLTSTLDTALSSHIW